MTHDDSVRWAPLGEIQHMLRRGDLSAVELMENTLTRIREENGAIVAIVALDEELAMQGAYEADARLREGGEVAPLTGIPTAVKDLEDACGFVTSRGTKAFMGSGVQTRDSIHVERLRGAGAVVIGKTNAPPMGSGIHTENEAYGVSRNPWDITRSPGGSSGGAAAAVSSGLIALGTAGDGGGSTRIPAALCGIVGLKPTRGLVPSSAGDVEDWTHHSTSTPMARTVPETALHLDIIAGFHRSDPYSFQKPSTSFVSALAQHPGRRRIGVHRDFGVTRPSPDVLRALDRSIEVLHDAGHELVELDTPMPGHESFVETILRRQAVLGLARRMRVQKVADERMDLFEPWFQEVLKRGGEVSNDELADYWRHRSALSKWAASLFQSVDCVLSPTTPTTAWRAEGPDVREAAAKQQIPIAFTSVFNDTGNPAISVPAGLGDDGLPVGVQLAAPHHEDALLMQLAFQLEESMPASRPSQI